MKKKIIAHLSIILILAGVFCNVCTNYNRISVFDSSVYAEADNWTSCDTSDLVTAFRYYCKSRNLALEGSVADALTSFTTSTFNNLCSTLGIDPTTLSAELKKTTEGNLGLRFLFSNTGITAYNRIFAEFLQNNDLAVGDTVDNEKINSGTYYTDGSGNGGYIYIVDYFTDGNRVSKYDHILQNGSFYMYGTNALLSLVGSSSGGTLLFNNSSYSFTCSVKNNGYLNQFYQVSVPSSVRLGFKATNYANTDGYYCLVKEVNKDSIYLCFMSNMYWTGGASDQNGIDTTHYIFYRIATKTNVPSEDIKNGDIYITTNNNTINNNSYNSNYTIIYNDGNTYISDDDDEPLPTTPPSGDGGGGGNDNPDNPDFPPVDPTPTPNPTIPDWDIELPEMPTGNDWLLYGLEKKFPWDIPYNLMYMLSLFAAEPETPHFEGTIDLKIVQWDYDIDLSPFDDIAGYVRDIEFIGFLLGLMLLTRKLIWG